MRKTTLALTAVTLLGGLVLGTGSASAAVQPGLQAGAAPTTYVAMMSRKKMMHHRMMRHKMMHRKMMMKKKMM